MTNLDMIELLTVVNILRNDDRRIPVRLSFALNRNYQLLKNNYQAYQDTVEKYKDDELEGGKLDEIFAIDIGDIQLQKVVFKDIDGADLSINEVEVIQRLMMDDE